MFKLTNSCDGAYSSLDVRFTKACDNNCAFCIEKTGIPGKKENLQKKIEETINSGIDDVLILGGEPFLFPTNLLEYISGIRNHVKFVRVTTSLPKTVTLSDPFIVKIMDSIDNLNVSIQSTDSEENNRILGAKSNHNRLDILKSLCQNYANKIRVSINLTKDGINSKEKLEKTLYDLKNLGVIHIKINEMQHCPEQYISYEDIMGIKLKSAYSYGCNTPISDNIVLKRSCFFVEDSAPIHFIDLVKAVYVRFFHKYKNKFRVLYEDGTIETAWLKK